MAGRKSPWGSKGDDEPSSSGGGTDSDASADEPKPSEEPKGPRNPWLSPSSENPRRSANIEDIFRARKGGGGGGDGGGFPRLPPRPGGKSWTPLILGLVGLAWVGLTSTHMLSPKEQGVVTTLGKYSKTIGAGVSLTLPWPIQNVSVREVTSINRFNIPESDSEKLMLTSDRNLVNLSYLIRWNIKNLKAYSFQLENPDQTLRDVAESAMRASVAEVPLRDVMGGAGRARIESAVQRRMQGVLDAYRSGVQIQGIDIRKADPPEKVNEAFQQVTVAQQQAQRDLEQARGFARTVIAQAESETIGFNRIYDQYRLAPDVTRRRLYYETMERVLSNNDKVVVEGTGVTSYLPLPELRRRAEEAPAEGAR